MRYQDKYYRRWKMLHKTDKEAFIDFASTHNLETCEEHCPPGSNCIACLTLFDSTYRFHCPCIAWAQGKIKGNHPLNIIRICARREAKLSK